MIMLPPEQGKGLSDKPDFFVTNRAISSIQKLKFHIPARKIQPTGFSTTMLPGERSRLTALILVPGVL
jgi:hypothetical protein